MLSVQDVARSYGRVAAVRGVSFEAPPGCVVGLLGPNGAGKSTTIRMITGFLPPDRGRVRVAGFDTVEQSAQARRRLGYLPESAPLYAEMSVRGYLDYRARLYELDRRERRSAVSASAERCRLGEVLHRRIGHLSKGYRQRVGLASAVLHDPEVIVLDEPSNGLDPTQVVEMRGLIVELGKTKTVLISSHILAEVERVCGRVVVMIRGEVRADGSPADLIGRTGGPGAYTVEVRAESEDPAGAVRAALVRVPGLTVVSAEARGAWVYARASGPSGEDAREAIARSLRTSGLLAREVSRERPTLEGVFMHLLESTPEGGPAARGLSGGGALGGGA